MSRPDFGVSEYVLRFTADWCAPCKVFAPTYDKASEHFDIPFKVIDVDDEDNLELVRYFKVAGIPTAFYVNDEVDYAKRLSTNVTVGQLVEDIIDAREWTGAVDI